VVATRILALVGSLRAGSHNRQLAEAAVMHAPEGVEVDIFEGLAELPFYNQDIDTPGNVPSADALRAAVAGADALLLCSPEYNGTMPALLKNAIDWISRPFGAGAISGKPVAVVGAAHGAYGGVWAQDDARKSVGIAGGVVVYGVKLSVPRSGERFADTHAAKDAEVAETIPQILAVLADARVQSS
jgi:NAD(P)H-dependent FMN reductase